MCVLVGLLTGSLTVNFPADQDNGRAMCAHSYKNLNIWKAQAHPAKPPAIVQLQSPEKYRCDMDQRQLTALKVANQCSASTSRPFCAVSSDRDEAVWQQWALAYCP